MGQSRRWWRVGLAVSVLALQVQCHAAYARPVPAQRFFAAPRSAPLYGVKAPDEDPARQRHIVHGSDGVDLYVETWLPKAKDGHEPPVRVPTVLIMSPYLIQGAEAYPANERRAGFIEQVVSRGYAVAQHHVRGTGESGGCIEQTADLQIDDGSRVVEYLGRDAPWSDGNVGMYGISYDAETQISVAGRGDPERTKWLKAIVPMASVGGQYEYLHLDGVPFSGKGAVNLGYYATLSALPGWTSTPQQYAQKPGCLPEQVPPAMDPSGDMTPFWQAREYRPGAVNIRAAMLYAHGLADTNVKPLTPVGLFDRMPAGTPRKALFGIWDHALPDFHPDVRPEWERSDWMPIVIAWFDRWLKGLDTGVERWPETQVQSTDGRWRTEKGWPRAGGPGTLRLGAAGRLLKTTSSGSTQYAETGLETTVAAVPGSQAVFETAPLRRGLHVGGQPILDLWVVLDRPDAHVAAALEAIGPDGVAVPFGRTFGLRSARHLDPMVEGRFAQTEGRDAPTGTPLLVPVRFLPTALAVPPGGRLRLTVAGSVRTGKGAEGQTGVVPSIVEMPSLPSASATTVRILHDADHASALRFSGAGRLLEIRAP